MRTLDYAAERFRAATSEVVGASRRISEDVTVAAVTFSENTAAAVSALRRTASMLCAVMVAVFVVALAALSMAAR